MEGKKPNKIENLCDEYPLFDIEVYKRENKDLNFNNKMDYYIHFINHGRYENRKYHNNIFHIYNKYHLGDNIFNVLLFNKISDYLQQNNMKIYYYCIENYHKQVGEFIKNKEVIILKKLNERNEQGLEAWINNENVSPRYELQSLVGQDRYYVFFYNLILEKMKIPIYIYDLKYEDDDLLKRRDNLIKEYKNLKILVINSEPLSDQFKYSKNDWNRFIVYLSNKFNIITTLKVNNIPCTIDNKLSCKDIAALSSLCDYIITINTGPFVGCYNKYTLEHVKKIYMFVDNQKYEHYKIQIHRDINELYSYF